MRRSLIILLALYFIGACSDGPFPNGDESLPNIVILLADDLGYGDLGCYGGSAHTPNLDALSRDGLLFTDFYAAAPNCSPSRAGLLTGRSPSRVGVYNYIPPNHPMHLRSEEVTLAEILKKRGYQTGHFGKWHLSCLPQNPSLQQPQPSDQGFDYSFGTANNAQPSHLDPVNFVRNGEVVGPLTGYACDLVTNEAIQWMGHVSAEHPFLLYLAYHEPHKKVASPPDLVSKYDMLSKQDAEYLANVENMDQAIGRLITYLRESGTYHNSLILFASDNGSYRNGSNGELLGGKSFVYEGGIRVPGILHWPKMISSNRVINEPAGLIDMVPTIRDLLAIEDRTSGHLDGQSLMPILHGLPFVRSKPLYWFFYRTTPEMAMRVGDFTILGRDLDSTQHTHAMTQPDMEIIRAMTLDDFELYNVRNDPGQLLPLDVTASEEAQNFLVEIQSRLKDIQSQGYHWQNLPPAKGMKRFKHEWRQLRPSGFSN